MFLFFGLMGVGQATGVMVGQNLGAGQPERAKKAILWGLGFVQIVPATVRLVMLLSPLLLITIFTRDMSVAEATSQLLALVVIAGFFQGFQQVFQSAFNTAGDTMTPMLVTMAAVFAVEIPLAWYLTTSTDLGLLGIGWAGIAGMAFRNVVYVPYYLSGLWLRRKLL
jgi:Na+-driven multidrug efflux pump